MINIFTMQQEKHIQLEFQFEPFEDELEEWKAIEGFEELYEISNIGNVKSLNYNGTGKERIMKQGNNGNGYLRVCLSKNGKIKKFLVHRLVAQAFLPNPKNYKEINHKDENKLNNCVSNLEWCDRQYNNNFGTRTEKCSKKVNQYTLEGKFIRQFPSTNQVERELGYFQSNISNCCNGKRKTAYNYLWKFE